MKKYTVFVPAPKDEAGQVPIKVSGSNADGPVNISMNIPFDSKVTDVPEPVVKVLKVVFPAGTYTEQE